MGRSIRNAVRSQLQHILSHYLKPEHSSATEPRTEWMNSIDEARDQIENLPTPSLRRDLEDQLSHLYARTRHRVDRNLRAYGEAAAADGPPEACPYRPEQLFDEERPPDGG